MISVFDSLFITLQDDYASSISRDRALSLLIKRLAVSIRRQYHPLLVLIAGFQRHGDARTTRHSDIAFTVQQRLSRKVNGYKRG
ncbi:hypothetical protein D3C75_1158210 [compost metagenome]